jgi:7SK snRNA methylphosphate capping enzyme
MDRGTGNYRGYYNYRNDGGARLASLRKEWFKGKKCVDLGCNSGHLTFDIAKTLRPESIVGVDSDEALIQRAIDRLRNTPEQPAPEVDSILLPRSLALKSQGTTAKRFPNNLSFLKQDLMSIEPSSLGTFDVVVCCSVSKWIHLNHGDAGLMKLFQLIYELLKEGGIAVFEYQPWKSYERNKNSSEKTREVFRTIRLRPELFEEILVHEIGFKILQKCGAPLEEARGFSRPILILRKNSNIANNGASVIRNQLKRMREDEPPAQLVDAGESDFGVNEPSLLVHDANLSHNNTSKIEDRKNKKKKSSCN